MKEINQGRCKLANIALWLFPVLLIVPNVVLAFTETWPALYKVADICLMSGIYLAIMSLTRKTGLVILLCLPFIFYAAFQIVLIYLYGSGIIAVDMFLNVVTTNVGEVTELLGNLTVAMLTVFVLYLPPLGWAIWALAKHKKADADRLAMPRRTGLALASIGAVLVVACYMTGEGYSVTKHVFPANTASNTIEAIKRTRLTANYANTSRGFRHGAYDTHPVADREIYVLVVGETSRADNCQLMGYARPTTPLLSQRSNLLAFPKALSESNTTHKSVPMILSHLDAHNFGDSIYHTKGIISAFAEAGYATVYVSAQRRNHSFIDFFGEEADQCRFIVEEGEIQDDANLLPHLKNALDTIASGKIFVVLHTYGSHFNYNDRYTQDHAAFSPTDYLSADAGNRDMLINAYDNTIHCIDQFLDRICSMLAEEGCVSAMMYLSDHGEDIFDDDRGRFLHASPTPTYYQLHVPFVAWMSDEYVSRYPSKLSDGRENEFKNVDSSQAAFHTMLDLAGLATPYFDAGKSLVSGTYMQPRRVYLNDYNEGVDLEHSGLKHQDYELLDKNGISYK